MHWLDWSILVIVLGLVTAIALYARRYSRSVADFLSANRCAGRYLLTMAEGAVGMGTIAIAAHFEKFYQAGFPAAWWGAIPTSVLMILALSGWVTYRFRATRALTMAQFFEIRYSKRFRIFSGMLGWLSGVLNYGIFPAVTGRFIVYFFGFPSYFIHLGPFDINVTLGIVMFVMLSISVLIATSGGQVTIMVTDFLQGSLFNVVFVTVGLFFLFKFGWGRIIEVLQQAPADKSMLNPFKQSGLEGFTVWYFVMHGVLQTYHYKAWQGSQGFNASAKSPHVARMAGILGGWRGMITFMLYALVPICAYTILNSPEYAPLAESIKHAIGNISDSQIQTQMTVPIALSNMLPVGLLGLVACLIVCATITSDDTNLHSWGSIFIQDVIIPLRKKHVSQEQHMRWLKFSIVGVATFVFIFSLLFPLKDYVLMYMQVTGAIFLGGAGSAVVGGLYWKRGTTAGAWTGMIAGTTVALAGIALKNILWTPLVAYLQNSFHDVSWIISLPVQFPLNGMKVAFIAAGVAIVLYVLVSLLTKPDPKFDMDRMLHRGKYAIGGEHQKQTSPGLLKWLGIGPEFTLGDKVIYLGQLGWVAFWFVVLIAGTAYNLYSVASDEMWAKWWGFYTGLTIILAVGITIWFLCGGIRDLIDLFKTLRTAKRDASDDGTVYHGGLPESRLPEKVEATK